MSFSPQESILALVDELECARAPWGRMMTVTLSGYTSYYYTISISCQVLTPINCPQRVAELTAENFILARQLRQGNFRP